MARSEPCIVGLRRYFVRFALTFVAFELVLAVAPAVGAKVPPVKIRITEYPYNVDSTGEDKPVEIGRFDVPASRAHGIPGSLEIGYTRFPSSSKGPADPVIFLSAGDLSIADQVLLAEIAKYRDAVALDLRGYGLSSPPAPCPGRVPIPFDSPMSLGDFDSLFTKHVNDCRVRFTENGLDARVFSANEVARDLSDLADALGAERYILVAKGRVAYIAYLASLAKPYKFPLSIIVDGEFPTLIPEGMALSLLMASKEPGTVGQDVDVLDLYRAVRTELLCDTWSIPVEIESDRVVQVKLGVTDIDMLTGLVSSGQLSSVSQLSKSFSSALRGDHSDLGHLMLRARQLLSHPDVMALFGPFAGFGEAASNSALAYALNWPVTASTLPKSESRKLPIPVRRTRTNAIWISTGTSIADSPGRQRQLMSRFQGCETMDLRTTARAQEFNVDEGVAAYLVSALRNPEEARTSKCH